MRTISNQQLIADGAKVTPWNHHPLWLAVYMFENYLCGYVASLVSGEETVFELSRALEVLMDLFRDCETLGFSADRNVNLGRLRTRLCFYSDHLARVEGGGDNEIEAGRKQVLGRFKTLFFLSAHEAHEVGKPGASQRFELL